MTTRRLAFGIIAVGGLVTISQSMLFLVTPWSERSGIILTVILFGAIVMLFGQAMYASAVDREKK